MTKFSISSCAVAPPPMLLFYNSELMAMLVVGYWWDSGDAVGVVVVGRWVDGRWVVGGRGAGAGNCSGNPNGCVCGKLGVLVSVMRCEG